MSWHLAKVSANRKLGPIAATTAPMETCPMACSLLQNGCYAELGPQFIHWKKVSDGERGTDFEEHCAEIARLKLGTMLRLHVAGDFVGKSESVDLKALHLLAYACFGLKAWTYTHYKDVSSINEFQNLKAWQSQPSLTINVSCDFLQEVDLYKGIGHLDCVSLIPTEAKVHRTPRGIKVVRCPAEYSDVTCATCGGGKPLCWRKNRDYAIGFYPHGARRKKVLEVVNNV